MTKIKRFEEGALYVKYVTGYKVTYRITKRTSKYITLYAVKVESDNPYSVFCANAVPDGMLADLGMLFEELRVSVDYLNTEDGYEYCLLWNKALGPIAFSCLNKTDKV